MLLEHEMRSYDEVVSKRSDDAGDARDSWRDGRWSRTRADTSEAIEQRYGIDKPDVIEDFLRERALTGAGDNREGECACGSGKGYWTCHGKPVAG